jgi:hypothetical protein
MVCTNDNRLDIAKKNYFNSCVNKSSCFKKWSKRFQYLYIILAVMYKYEALFKNLQQHDTGSKGFRRKNHHQAESRRPAI